MDFFFFRLLPCGECDLSYADDIAATCGSPLSLLVIEFERDRLDNEEPIPDAYPEDEEKSCETGADEGRLAFLFSCCRTGDLYESLLDADDRSKELVLWECGVGEVREKSRLSNCGDEAVRNSGPLLSPPIEGLLL